MKNNFMEHEEKFYGMAKLSDIKPNPSNPRTIKQSQLNKLKKSIQDFPQMLELRPIILDETMTILGGNMRLRALKELGYEEVPYIRIDDLTEEQKREFIVKDNVNYGDWNWEQLQTDWDLTHINDWGLDAPAWLFDDDKEPEIDRDDLDKAMDAYINAQVKRIVLFFNNEEYADIIRKLKWLSDKNKLESNTEVLKFLLDFYGKNTIND